MLPTDLPAAAATAARPRPLALALPLLLMAAGALTTGPPWNLLWIVVPGLGAAGYLANLHHRRLGWMAPAVAAGWALALPQGHSVWGWLMVGAIASAALLGLARRGAATAGRDLWSLLPLLGLAVAFPLSGSYGPMAQAAASAAQRFGEEMYRNYETLGLEGGRLGEIAKQLEQATAGSAWIARHLLPSLFFAWAVGLVALATLLARRAARAAGRPLATGAGLAGFRLPEGALWLLLAALALIALRQPPLLLVGGNLAACLGMGYCLQGMAVMDFALLARGFPAGMILVLFLFVTFFAPPVLLVTSMGLGVADVWLDLRRRVRESGGKGGEA